jgi:phosphoenolpyruvate carboxylase
VPKLYLSLAAQIRAKFGMERDVAVPPFLRLGSWIGGDRDGNPNVNSKTLSYAIDRQATLAFTHYLDEIHRLGAELSLSTRLVTPSKELLQLAEAPHDPNPHRGDEPYRQALIGVYGRVAATARALASYVPPLAPHADLPPYPSSDALLTDLRVIEASLAGHGATPLPKAASCR